VTQRLPQLVGRSEELAFCESVLAHSGAPGIVVTGAAGVGKTRLASEVLAAAEMVGYATVRVTATEAGRAIPLGPFAGVLPVDADAGAASVQMLGLVRRGIATREDGRRVALFVDDAHLLDAASAMLVQQLAAAREATVIATLRTGELVPDALVALWKDHGCEYLELQPLSLEETGELIESLVEGDVDGQTKHRLSDASLGVPLVVRELILDGLQRKVLVSHLGVWRWEGLPQAGGRLLALIGARIGQLDDDERSVLELVAVGEPLSSFLLAANEAEAADALLRRQLVIVERDGRRLEIRLAHPLYGESVRAGMLPTRLAALQVRLADALDAAGLRRSGDLLRFAVFRLESGGRVTPEVFVRSAYVAFSSMDFALSERLARASVEFGSGFDGERATALALNAQARFDEAEATLVSLMETARTDEELTAVALTRATSLAGTGRNAASVEMLIDAEARVSAAACRRELECARYMAFARSGRLSEALSGFTHLLEGDDVPGDFRVMAASWTAGALVQSGRPDEALATVARWEPLAPDNVDVTRPFVVIPAAIRANFWDARIGALLCDGRLAQAEDAASDAYDRLIRGASPMLAVFMAVHRGAVALVRGRLEAARRSFREAVAQAPPGDLFFLPQALAFISQAEAQAGNPAGARRAMDDVGHPPEAAYWDPDVLLGRAWAAASEGAQREAQILAGEAADLAEERGALAAAFVAAHDIVRLGDPGAGSARLSRLAGEVEGGLVVACAEHAQAAVDADAPRIERAAARFAEMGALLWAAEADSEAAAAHRAAGREQSARAAAARSVLLLEQCEGARTPVLALAGAVVELTPREREIAGLAAGGLSNRVIAERLVVSVRTVENNLQRAYGKLGVRNRRELAGVVRATELE
jgi:DNA-binding NarL/FixJ family response regulator